MTAPVEAEAQTTASEQPAVETPAVEVPQQEPQQQEPAKTKAEARRRALERVRQGLAPPEEPAVEAPALEEQPAEGPEGDQPAAETGAAPAGEAPVEAPAGEQAPVELEPKQTYMVVIPASHPMTGGVKKELAVDDPEVAKQVKALVNGTYYRRKDVEQAQTEARDWEDKYVELKTRYDTEKEYQKSDSYKQRLAKAEQYRQLEADGELPAGATEEFLSGSEAELERMAADRLKAERDTKARERTQKIQRAFENEAYSRAQEALPNIFRAVPAIREHFDDAVAAFTLQLNRNRYPNLQPGDAEGFHREFATFLNSFLITKPDVRNAMTQLNNQRAQQAKAEADAAKAKEAERARIEQEAIDRHMKKLAADRGERPPHPLGNLQRVSHDRATGEPPTDELPRDAGALAAKKHGRASAKARARAMFNR